MQFPLTLWDLLPWLAVTSIILLATSELVSTHHGQTSIILNKKRLQNTALTVGIMFLIAILANALITYL